MIETRPTREPGSATLTELRALEPCMNCACKVWLWLRVHADLQGIVCNGRVVVLSRIATDLGINKNSVLAALNKLEAGGLIQRETATGCGSKYTLREQTTTQASAPAPGGHARAW